MDQSKDSDGPVVTRAPLRLTALPHAFGPVILTTVVTVTVLVTFLAVRGLPPRAGLAEAQRLSDGDTIKAPEIFGYGVADYKARLESFAENIGLQAFIIVVSVLLIVRRSDSLNVFGNEVPLRWLHFFVPVVMTYLWLQFGFVLDDLIKTRMRVVDLVEPDHMSITAHSKAVFWDSGFIDGWFLSFIDTKDRSYSGINPNSAASTGVFLLAVLGTLVSAAHGCALAILSIGCRRYMCDVAGRWLVAYYLSPFIPLAFFLASHLQFAYGGGNRNWIQLPIALGTLCVMAGLTWLSVSADARSDITSVQCLRRQRCLEHPVPPAWQNLRGQAPDARGQPPLKHIVLIGDSLSTGFHLCSVPEMLWRPVARAAAALTGPLKPG